jgi:hypothetical protein
MRRIAGAALFGLGVLCVLLAMALAWIIVPSQRKVPLDLVPPDVVVETANASFVQAKMLPNGTPQVVVENAGLRSTTGIKPDFRAAAELDGETLVWNVYHSTNRIDTGEMINSSESRVALDRRSGEAVPWEGQCHVEQQAPCSPGNVAFAGHLYLFPFGTEKRAYDYWDSSLHRALPMQYQAEEEFNGLPAYRFQQQIPEQQVPMDQQSLAGMLGFLAPRATGGLVSYRATRTLWVEPMTGAIVGYREQQHRELVPDLGERVVIFDADLQYDQATLNAVGARAADGRDRMRLLGVIVPIGLAVLGLALLAGGLLVSAGAGPRARRVTEAPRPQPTPAR